MSSATAGQSLGLPQPQKQSQNQVKKQFTNASLNKQGTQGKNSVGFKKTNLQLEVPPSNYNLETEEQDNPDGPILHNNNNISQQPSHNSSSLIRQGAEAFQKVKELLTPKQLRPQGSIFIKDNQKRQSANMNGNQLQLSANQEQSNSNAIYSKLDQVRTHITQMSNIDEDENGADTLRYSKHKTQNHRVSTVQLRKIMTVNVKGRFQEDYYFDDDEDEDEDQRKLRIPCMKHQITLPKFNCNKKLKRTVKRCSIIRQNDRFRTIWDVVIIILSLYNCFVLPVDIAFEPASLETNAIVALNYIIDVAFSVDIFLNFRTTIVNDLTGDEITDSKVIAKSYLKGRFFLDLLATLPFDEIIQATSEKGKSINNLNFFQMLKIFRILRFTKIIVYLNATESVKLSLKLFKLIFYLIIYLHWQACAWFFYTKWDRTWYPLVDIINRDYHFYDHGFYYTYCFSVWHSVEFLDGGDMVPATGHQALVVSVLIILSEFIHAHILGTIEVVLLALNRKSTKFQEQLEFATSTMKNLKLQEGVQHKVLEYLGKKFNELDTLEDLKALMEMLSPSLKHMVTQQMFLSAIQSISIFHDIPDLVDYLVYNIEAMQFMPEELIIKQGQKPTHMYILSQGQCEVLVKDQFKKDVFVRDISPGMLFGEVALIFGTRRTASVKSLDQCTVGGLSDEIFFDMLKNFPEIENMLRIGTRQYSDHWKQYQIKALSQVDYLEEIPYSLLEEMHYRLTIENYEKGARIFNRGQECKQIIFVTSGELELVVEQNGTDYLLDNLGMGSVLGQYSIINESQYQFSGKAKTKLTLLVLERNELLTFAEDNEQLAEAIEDATNFIIDCEVPICDYKLGTPKPLSVKHALNAKVISLTHAPSLHHPHHSSTIHPRLSQQQLQEQIKVKTPKMTHVFREAVRKVKVLNHRKEMKVFRLFELINYIRNEKQKIANQAQAANENKTSESGVPIIGTPKVEQLYSPKAAEEIQPRDSIAIGPKGGSKVSSSSLFGLSRNDRDSRLARADKRRSSFAFQLPSRKQSSKKNVRLGAPSPSGRFNDNDDRMGPTSKLSNGSIDNYGDHFLTGGQSSKNNFEITKMNRKLEQILAIVQGLQSDIGLMKGVMKIPTANNRRPSVSPQTKRVSILQSRNSQQVVGGKQPEMTNILEEVVEDDSGASNSSVSDISHQPTEFGGAFDGRSSIDSERRSLSSRYSVKNHQKFRMSQLGNKIGVINPVINEVVKDLMKQNPTPVKQSEEQLPQKSQKTNDLIYSAINSGENLKTNPQVSQIPSKKSPRQEYDSSSKNSTQKLIDVPKANTKPSSDANSLNISTIKETRKSKQINDAQLQLALDTMINKEDPPMKAPFMGPYMRNMQSSHSLLKLQPSQKSSQQIVNQAQETEQQYQSSPPQLNDPYFNYQPQNDSSLPKSLDILQTQALQSLQSQVQAKPQSHFRLSDQPTIESAKVSDIKKIVSPPDSPKQVERVSLQNQYKISNPVTVSQLHPSQVHLSMNSSLPNAPSNYVTIDEGKRMLSTSQIEIQSVIDQKQSIPPHLSKTQVIHDNPNIMSLDNLTPQPIATTQLLAKQPMVHASHSFNQHVPHDAPLHVSHNASAPHRYDQPNMKTAHPSIFVDQPTHNIQSKNKVVPLPPQPLTNQGPAMPSSSSKNQTDQPKELQKQQVLQQRRISSTQRLENALLNSPLNKHAAANNGNKNNRYLNNSVKRDTIDNEIMRMGLNMGFIENRDMQNAGANGGKRDPTKKISYKESLGSNRVDELIEQEMELMQRDSLD